MVFFAALLFFVPGLLGIFFPTLGWYIRYGWMVDGDSEPSDAFIFMSRLGGFIAIILGFAVLFSGGSILNFN
ncbi:hypothetical protein Back11_10560 [Paenibacillus baekrokdamisoli]|uniref:DUF6199 domain-containing protein n=1 Tax=Paenibacillus baekrokdamisoli TaxID=1712516 RepID=A0A3G9J1J1_9BACL|nr:DUF6199 family natural product biosynthesis protein [Paenibacillus baekrokdamisoli]MBB3067096.1 hypothetical protein [Paenibacillus baekrokdamisoli]BBH19711.1 hypothetical protein Back11_10560 [Paenibacillus baekrokdamisoli]